MHRNLLELPKEPANLVLIQVFKHNISFYRISRVVLFANFPEPDHIPLRYFLVFFDYK